MTEHELAVWFDVAPVFVVGWIETSHLEAHRDEVGYVITNLEAAQFEDEHLHLIEGARSLTAAAKRMGVARATLKRLGKAEIAASGDDDGA